MNNGATPIFVIISQFVVAYDHTLIHSGGQVHGGIKRAVENIDGKGQKGPD